MNSVAQRPRVTPSLCAQVRMESKRTPKRRLQNGGESFYAIGVGSSYVVKANNSCGRGANAVLAPIHAMRNNIFG